MNFAEKKAETNNQKHCTELEYHSAQTMTFSPLLRFGRGGECQLAHRSPMPGARCGLSGYEITAM